MSKPTVFGLTGEMLSGKSIAAKFLVDHFAAKELRMSAVLGSVLEVLDLPQTRENFQNLGKILREQFGEEILAHTLTQYLQEMKGSVFVVDGIRKVEEMNELRRNTDLCLIYVVSLPEQRYARLKQRTEKTGEHLKSMEEFMMDHKAESEIDIPKLRQFADYVVLNSGNEQNLHAELTKIFMETI